jgi:hypothetical protein
MRKKIFFFMPIYILELRIDLNKMIPTKRRKTSGVYQRLKFYFDHEIK